MEHVFFFYVLIYLGRKWGENDFGSIFNDWTEHKSVLAERILTIFPSLT